MGSKYGVHMSLLSDFTNIAFFGWNFVFDDYVNVHFYCLLQNLSLLLCTHSLHHPWLSTEGSGNITEGSGLHPLWSEGVRRIGCIVCCAETWGGTSRAWDIILWHPTLRGPLGSPPCSTAFPHHAVFASWVDGCAAPLLRWHLDRCGDAVKQRDTFFNWGIASEASAAHIQRMITCEKGCWFLSLVLSDASAMSGVNDGVMIGVMILWSRGTTLLIGA